MEETQLQHFGVKGMRWGVRKRNDVGIAEVTVLNDLKRTPTARIVTKKGAGITASDDAARAAGYKQIAKKSGTNALDNKQLQALVTRMNLEHQYSRLQPTPKSKAAKKMIGDILLNVGKQQATRIANDAAAKQVAGMLKRR